MPKTEIPTEMAWALVDAHCFLLISILIFPSDDDIVIGLFWGLSPYCAIFWELKINDPCPPLPKGQVGDQSETK